MKKSWKIVFMILLVLASGVLAAVLFLRRLEVEVWEAQPRLLTRTVTEEGNVRAGVEFTVYAMYRGRLDQIKVQEGERVDKDQLLAVLDTRELGYEMAELQARMRMLEGEELKLSEQPGAASVRGKKLAIEQTEAQLRAAAREYERRRKLYAEEAITEEQYHQAKDRLTDAEYQLSRQREALQILFESYDPPPGSQDIIAARRLAYQAQKNMVRYRLGEHQIYAPVTGVVGRLKPEEKELVDPQTPLMTVFHDDTLVVEVKVLTRDRLLITPETEVSLSLESATEGVEFTGKIVRIAPQAEKDLSPLGLEERRVKVTVAPDFPSGLQIGPGYELDVTFVIEQKSDQLAVPERALFTDQGQDALLVIEDGRVRMRRVKTGFSAHREAAIEEGLEAGDQVVVNPRQEGLREGIAVRTRRVGPRPD